MQETMGQNDGGDDAMIIPSDLIRKRDRIYFKSPAGNPVRTETRRGDGWDILRKMDAANSKEFSRLHNPSIYAYYIRIWNWKE